MHVGYVNVFVSDFERARQFFADVVGLEPNQVDASFGYASFDAGPISFAIAQTDNGALIGRHTGIGFITDDIDATYEALVEQGVEFEMPPTEQPWGGTLALFLDPDHNVYYLDPGHSG